MGSTHKDLIVNFKSFLSLLAVSHINKRRYVIFYRAIRLNTYFQFKGFAKGNIAVVAMKLKVLQTINTKTTGNDSILSPE